jgi:hypothetical protein
MIYILLFIYFFADPVLCQADSLAITTQTSEKNLESLKTVLSNNTTEFNTVYQQYNNYCNLYNEGLKHSNLDFDIIAALYKAKTISLRYVEENMAKVRITEENIRLIDPSFVSAIAKQWFEFE